jgi:hypothetical protein
MKLHNYLRPTANLSLFGAFLFMLYGASYRPQTTAAGIVDHYKVGDVVYSLLDPPNFFRLHGGVDAYGETKWRGLYGSTLSANTDLRKYFSTQLIGGTNLPDARGVFLRGMNEDRSTSTGDANGNRNIGVSQSDMVGSHSHTSTMRTYPASFTNGGLVPAIEAQSPIPSQGRNPITIGPDGGPETRPRNIALYIYIKVSE